LSSRSKKITDAQLARLNPLIEEAITVLRQRGELVLAEAVAELARSTPGWGGRGKMTNTTFRADAALMDRIAEKFPTRPVSDIAREAIELFVTGNLTVQRIPRGGEKKNVNVRLADDVMEQLGAACTAVNAADKYAFKVTPSVVFISYLETLAPAPQE
jgi:hypothetical protein